MSGKARPSAQQIGVTADGRQVVRLACEASPFELAVEGADKPQQWIHMCPAGPFVESRDGRTFQVSDPLKLAASAELPLLVDKDHESESWVGSTEAQGWVEEIRVQLEDDGDFPRAGIWGRAEWTPDGHELVKTKTYRFLSPVLLLDGETRDAFQLVSIALTNRPALKMQGLESYRQRFTAQFGQLHEGERNMKPETVKLLLAALALADGASDEQVIEAFKAKVNADPGKEQRELLSRQLGEANAKVVALESKLADSTKVAFAAEVTAVLDQASKDGKVPPAARAGYEAMCRTPEMFATFKDSILPNLVAIAAPAPKSPAVKPESFRAELRAKGYSDAEIDAAAKVRTNGQLTATEED